MRSCLKKGLSFHSYCYFWGIYSSNFRPRSHLNQDFLLTKQKILHPTKKDDSNHDLCKTCPKKNAPQSLTLRLWKSDPVKRKAVISGWSTHTPRNPYQTCPCTYRPISCVHDEVHVFHQVRSRWRRVDPVSRRGWCGWTWSPPEKNRRNARFMFPLFLGWYHMVSQIEVPPFRTKIRTSPFKIQGQAMNGLAEQIL